MEWSIDAQGCTVVGISGRVRLGPFRPAVLVDTGSGANWWRPETVRAEEGRLVAGPGPGGVELEVDLLPVADFMVERVDVAVRLRNTGSAPLRVERLVALDTQHLVVGENPRRWRMYRNGYQSWSGTTSFGTDERDADVPVRVARAGVNDAKYAAPASAGHVRSDVVGAVCDPESGDAVAVTQLDAAAGFGFTELVAPGGVVERFTVWVDLDGVSVDPGETSESHRFAVCTSTGPNGPWAALEGAVAATGDAMSARRGDAHHPSGWCSWYYHFAKVTAADV
ncbi:MAG: hypothetical protein ACKOYM_06575, partial [Actinomycetes bacterium]